MLDATLMVDDFFPTGSVHGMTDGAGKMMLTFPADAANAGAGKRFLHITAGPTYPFVEQILAID